jgi:hypothetical protein
MCFACFHFSKEIAALKKELTKKHNIMVIMDENIRNCCKQIDKTLGPTQPYVESFGDQRAGQDGEKVRGLDKDTKHQNNKQKLHKTAQTTLQYIF